MEDASGTTWGMLENQTKTDERDERKVMAFIFPRRFFNSPPRPLSFHQQENIGVKPELVL